MASLGAHFCRARKEEPPRAAPLRLCSVLIVAAAVAERVLAGVIFPVCTHAAAAAETRTAGRTAAAGTVIRLCRRGRGETVRAATGRAAAAVSAVAAAGRAAVSRIAAAAVVRAAAPRIAAAGRAAGRTAGSKQDQIDQIHICFPPRKR